MNHQNPFRVIVNEAGNIQAVMEKLHPVSYSTIYQYIRGRTTSISRTMRKALERHYTPDEIDAMEREYKAWREERSEQGNS